MGFTTLFKARLLLPAFVFTGLCFSTQSPQPPQTAAPGQATAPAAGAQTPGTQDASPPNEPAHRGGFVPGQRRAPAAPAVIARGKTLFGINCRGCHGADLRGGDLGGPNLLRSQLALSDVNGEQIVPVIHGSRAKMGMPAIPLSDPDAQAVAAYVRSVIESIKGQGAPPSAGKEVTTIIVGNAEEGKAYFAAKCSTCHSASGDLAHIAGRIKDERRLQDAWLAGGTRQEEEEDPKPGAAKGPRTVTALVTPATGEPVEGVLLRQDEFLVTIGMPDGTQRTFARNGGTPKVEVRDPLKAHRDLLSQYTDKDIHDLTAYLVTLK